MEAELEKCMITTFDITELRGIHSVVFGDEIELFNKNITYFQ